MENEKLFRVCTNGYNCDQVDEYIRLLKAEYKKLYDFAKGNEERAGIAAQRITDLSSENARLNESAIAFEAEKAVLQKKLEESERRVRALAAGARAPQAENAPQTVPDAPAGRSEDYEMLKKSLSTMTMLSEEVVFENRELRKRLSAYETV